MNCIIEGGRYRLNQALAQLPAEERIAWDRRLGLPRPAAAEPSSVFGCWRLPSVLIRLHRRWRQSGIDADRRCYLIGSERSAPSMVGDVNGRR
jgi:hypothetical protein